MNLQWGEWRFKGEEFELGVVVFDKLLGIIVFGLNFLFLGFYFFYCRFMDFQFWIKIYRLEGVKNSIINFGE